MEFILEFESQYPIFLMMTLVFLGAVQVVKNNVGNTIHTILKELKNNIKIENVSREIGYREECKIIRNIVLVSAILQIINWLSITSYNSMQPAQLMCLECIFFSNTLIFWLFSFLGFLKALINPRQNMFSSSWD